jgi:GNAT superfamily N-acetyltransferase
MTAATRQTHRGIGKPSTPMIRIAPLAATDRAGWERLARGYKAFYKTDIGDSDYETAWRRLLLQDDVFGLGARSGSELVGIAHYFFHTSTWAPLACHLQDLFVDPASRGKGVARALIEAVAEASRSRGAQRLYWHTQEHNATARALYDRIARFSGFIRYDYPL